MDEEMNEMNEMTLPLRPRIRNSSFGGLRLPIILNLYVSLTLECQSGVRIRYLRLSKQAALTLTAGG